MDKIEIDVMYTKCDFGYDVPTKVLSPVKVVPDDPFEEQETQAIIPALGSKNRKGLSVPPIREQLVSIGNTQR